MSELTPSEKKIAAHLLSIASETFSNHGCNDYDLALVIPDQEDRDALVHDVYGDEDYFAQIPGDAEDYRLTDWRLMDLMAKRLRESASTT